MKKGILILALGNSNYYQMAVALAASIKTEDPDLDICLITDHDVRPEHEKLFDMIKEPIEKAVMDNDQRILIKAKLFLDQMTPFDETLFLDCDQILMHKKKLSPVFDQLKKINLTMSNTGLAGQSIWADIQEVKKLYGDKPFWNYHSEFFYFKKSPETKKYFAAAVKAYEANKVKSAVKFAGGKMADELAFQIASMMTGIYPHQENWHPNFWFDRDKANSRKYPYQLTEYLTYSVGGKTIPLTVKNNYNILVSHYFKQCGLQNPYRLQDKSSYLPERKLI